MVKNKKAAVTNNKAPTKRGRKRNSSARSRTFPPSQDGDQPATASKSRGRTLVAAFDAGERLNTLRFFMLQAWGVNDDTLDAQTATEFEALATVVRGMVEDVSQKDDLKALVIEKKEWWDAGIQSEWRAESIVEANQELGQRLEHETNPAEDVLRDLLGSAIGWWQSLHEAIEANIDELHRRALRLGGFVDETCRPPTVYRAMCLPPADAAEGYRTVSPSPAERELPMWNEEPHSDTAPSMLEDDFDDEEDDFPEAAPMPKRRRYLPSQKHEWLAPILSDAWLAELRQRVEELGLSAEMLPKPPTTADNPNLAMNFLVEVREWVRTMLRGAALPKADKEPFVPTPLQCEILRVLDGRALRKADLADKVCGGHGATLYKKSRGRKGALRELMDRNLVVNDRRIGYFRPDKPPKQLG
jgi:hypothetical protein